MVDTATTSTGILNKGMAAFCFSVLPQFAIYNLQFSINLKISNFKFKISRGFTIIELIVVFFIIGTVGAAGLYGLSQYNNSAPLSSAQKEFLTTLRSLQNQVVNGSDGVSVKSLILPAAASCSATGCSYTIVYSYLPSTAVTRVVSLPKGVIFSGLSTNPRAICFSHPNLASFSAARPCVTDAPTKAGCTSSAPAGFICNGVTLTVDPTGIFTVTLAKGTTQKRVVLEGSGMKINRIYAL